MCAGGGQKYFPVRGAWQGVSGEAGAEGRAGEGDARADSHTSAHLWLEDSVGAEGHGSDGAPGFLDPLVGGGIGKIGEADSPCSSATGVDPVDDRQIRHAAKVAQIACHQGGTVRKCNRGNQ